jgi:hypothetical protein
MNKNNCCTDIYFGKYINDNIISLDILDNNLFDFVNSNFKKQNNITKKIYQYNNLYYEIIGNKHKCYKKNNLKVKEFKKHNIVVKVFTYDKKYLDLDIFPSITEYYNEEEHRITEYSNDLKIIKMNDISYICLNNFNQDLINQITKVLN